ncbi:hypothetical protein AB0T83_18565 [Fluviibacterium sp. DFM31]|uniref:Recombinase n=1 Tax=Meridianimarinicoccus marinus TaxID=3231483 RepID=A0ABV3LCN5_9RHOB
MRIHNEDNERIKRSYMIYLQDAKGQDEKTIDKVLAAIRRFEESTKFKPFKAFHIDQARAFKAALAKAKNARTGQASDLFDGRCHSAVGEGILPLVGGATGLQIADHLS